MIYHVIGVPYHSQLTMNQGLLEAGIRVAGSSSTPDSRLPSTVVAHVFDVKLLSKEVNRLSSDTLLNMLFLTGSLSRMKDYGLPVATTFYPSDVRLLLEAPTVAVRVEDSDVESRLLKDACQKTFLGNLHTLFYRVQANYRDACKERVYAYLAGIRKGRPTTNVPAIDSLLSQGRCKVFIRCCIEASKDLAAAPSIAENAGLDSFEVMYVLKKAGVIK